LILPSRDLTPAQCRPKITVSTAYPECLSVLSGGYKVQEVPGPPSKINEKITRHKAGTRSQNLIAFNRGRAISGAPNNKGSIQFPKPPTIAGITIKKIIINA